MADSPKVSLQIDDLGGASYALYAVDNPYLTGLLHPSTHMLHVWNIYTNICPKNHPNVVKYTIHGAYGVWDGYLILKLNYNPISSHF